ncbi:MAG: polymerase III subunit beta protein [Berkelbacteria bacterium GW2011_GWA2_35_9]|uniref:Beta sliding clamp n=1 Tax=Berkelbacteria bacterium GW2011_GWA2_35_9 TaxID=1618333 RepID=A0A0G0FLM4_9BACT|nr:MAG: polymerase III subunit beta protein [Berkelbacteria bacterium GW2011_GWA2_35_9]
MKAICLSENLASGLAIISRVTGRNTILPILNNVLIEASNGKMILSSTNLEMAVTTKIGANVKSSGKLTVPARLMYEFVSLNKDNNISLELDGTKFNLISEKNSASLNTLSVNDFPPIPESEDGLKISLDKNHFFSALEKVVFACAIDETRPVLTGVYLKIEHNQLTLVGTDSYRLAEIVLPNIGIDEEVEILIPATTILELVKIFTKDDSKIELNISSNQIEINDPKTTIISKLISGNFPEYKEIIPTSFKTTIVIEKKELVDSLKLAQSFSRDNAGNVVFKIKENNLTIISRSDQFGENISKVNAEISGEDIKITFNVKFILELADKINYQKITLSLNESSSPVKISSDELSNFTYIVMPLKVEEKEE